MLFWDPCGGWINSVPGCPFPLGRRQSSYCTSICPPAEASGQRRSRAWEDPHPSHRVSLENGFFLWVQPKGPTITPIHRESLSTKNEIATPSSTHIPECTYQSAQEVRVHLYLPIWYSRTIPGTPIASRSGTYWTFKGLPKERWGQKLWLVKAVST